jgi:hypothetical protein
MLKRNLASRVHNLSVVQRLLLQEFQTLDLQFLKTTLRFAFGMLQRFRQGYHWIE